jgi:hypothetical protein
MINIAMHFFGNVAEADDYRIEVVEKVLRLSRD